MMKLKRTAILFVALSLGPSSLIPVRAQRLDRASLAANVDAVAAEALKAGPVAGLSIAVMRKGELLLAKGYGYADLENEVPATAETLFGIRSVTKNFTAALLLKLAEEGKLALEDPAGKHLPDLPAHWQAVTVRQLLSHTSGIKNLGGDKWRRNYRLGLTPAEWLSLYRDEPPDFAPGAGYAYSNTGYLILHLLIEKATGQTYEQAMQRRVGEPLGLTSLVMADGPPLLRRRTREYELREGRLVNAATWGGRGSAAGGLGATVIDLVRYAQALAAGRLLRPATLQLMRAPTRIADGPAIDYGLGTRLGQLGGRRLLGHTGDGGGGTAALAHYPDDDLTVAVLTNTEAHQRHATILQSRIAQKVLGLRTDESPLTAEEMKVYAGEWAAGKVRIRVFEQSGKLMGRPAGAPAPDLLMHLGGGWFILREQPEQGVRFLVEGGRVDWGLLYWAGFFIDVMRRVPPESR